TGTPKSTSAAPSDMPPTPPPTMQMSGLRTSTCPTPKNIRSGQRGRTRTCAARAQPLDDHRDQGDHAQRRERGEQPRRCDHANVEMDFTVGVPCREASAIDAFLGRNHAVQAGPKKGECE